MYFTPLAAFAVLSAIALAPQTTPPASRPTAPPAAPAAAPATPPASAPETVQNVDEMPPIEAVPPMVDLGLGPLKAPLKGTVQLKNLSDKPLKILLVTPSCKCTTTSDMTNKVIPANGSIEMGVELDAVAMPRTQDAMLRILVEGYGKIMELRVKGESSMPIRSNPAIINAVEGKGRTGRLVIESVDRKPFTICAVGGRRPEFVGFDASKDEPKSLYLVKYDLDTWQPSFPAYLVVETDRPECPTFDVWIRSEGTIPTPGFKMKEFRLNAGRIDIGGTGEISVDMDDTGEEIFAVESGSPDVEIKLKNQVGDGKNRKVTLSVTPKDAKGGLFYTPLRLYSREKEQALIMFGTARPKGATGCTGCVAVEPPPPASKPTGTAALPEQPARR